MLSLSKTSKDRLTGVHPDLIRVINQALAISTIDFTILEGLRTVERQRKLVAQGASKTMASRHITGHAVDIAPYLDTDGDGDKEISWAWPHYHQLAPIIKQAAKDVGVTLTWGGDWKSFKDGPHWELNPKDYPFKEGDHFRNRAHEKGPELPPRPSPISISGYQPKATATFRRR